MRYLLAFFCAVFALAGLPPSTSAQGDQGTQRPRLVWDGGALLLGGALEPSPNSEWAEWSDLEWMLWLLQAEPAVEPEPAWPPPSPPLPPADGSWLRLEADANGVSVIPMEPSRYTPAEEEATGSTRRTRGLRIGIPVALGVLALAVTISMVAVAKSIESGFQ
jgi:hypothetical protein